MFFHSQQQNQWLLMAKHVTVIKLTVVVVCLLLTGTIFIIIILYKLSVFLVFRRKRISYDPYSTRWYHVLHSFFKSVVDPPGILFCSQHNHLIKANFKNLECYHGLKSLLILILIFGVKANLTLISFVFYLKDNVFTVLVKQQNHIITKKSYI